MTILDPLHSVEEERAQRRASLLFALLVIIVVGACLFFAYVIFIPQTRTILVGSVSEFPIGRPIERAIPRLSITAFIRNRPRVSQDLVYITHRSGNTWQALLGTDVQSGCFLRWDPGRQLYEDACSGRRYDHLGRNTSDEQGALNMARLPITIDAGNVYIVDRLCTKENPCP